YVRTYDVDALITRGANTYGPRQYPEKFLPLFITNAFERQQLPVYVGGQQRENMEVVRRILDYTGASPDLVRHVTDRPGHDRRYSVDSSKLRKLGWTPRHSFDATGLTEI